MRSALGSRAERRERPVHGDLSSIDAGARLYGSVVLVRPEGLGPGADMNPCGNEVRVWGVQLGMAGPTSRSTALDCANKSSTFTHANAPWPGPSRPIVA